MEVEVLFSTDGILALNKPAAMVSQGPKTSTIPELCELVRTRYPYGHIAHRIDQFTSGINLAGVSRHQLSYLQTNWHQITRKIYLAIINNPPWSEKIVNTPIKGKSAVTSFTLLERSGAFALVQCQLVKNGRTHQIRRHLKLIGSPIIGDQKYKGSQTEARAGQLLHAWCMEVRLPDGSWATIYAPIPDDFRKFDFVWSQWDAQSNIAIETWTVPSDWKR